MNQFDKNLLLLFLKNIKSSNLKVAKMLALELIAKKKKKKQHLENEEESEGFAYHY